jgi:hypothetical protein
MQYKIVIQPKIDNAKLSHYVQNLVRFGQNGVFTVNKTTKIVMNLEQVASALAIYYDTDRANLNYKI